MNTQTDAGMDRETISALMDGQLRGADLALALRGMDADEARECWLLYHTIGDVLRTPELAQCGRDAAFVSRLSLRLSAESGRPAQAEAVVTASVAQDLSRPAANDGLFRWKMVAGLTTFAAVAAIGWSAFGSFGPQGGAPQPAQLAGVQSDEGAAQVAIALAPAPAPVPASAVSAASAAPVASMAAASVPGAEAAPVMLRDPRLDELLAAHRAAAGTSALGNQAGFFRNATFSRTGR